MGWHHDKTTRPWYAAGKMFVRKQLNMNTLIPFLLSSIATQLVRFIAGRLLSAQVVQFWRLWYITGCARYQTQILFSPAARVSAISGRRPGTMHVFIVLVLETDACFIRRCMKRCFLDNYFGPQAGSHFGLDLGSNSCQLGRSQGLGPRMHIGILAFSIAHTWHLSPHTSHLTPHILHFTLHVSS